MVGLPWSVLLAWHGLWPEHWCPAMRVRVRVRVRVSDGRTDGRFRNPITIRGSYLLSDSYHFNLLKVKCYCSMCYLLSVICCMSHVCVCMSHMCACHTCVHVTPAIVCACHTCMHVTCAIVCACHMCVHVTCVCMSKAPSGVDSAPEIGFMKLS